LTKKTGQWLHKAKRHYLENKAERGEEILSSAELAELVVLKSEETAWAQIKGGGGADEPSVSSKKHNEMTKVLREKIDALPEEKRDQILARPAPFVDYRVNAVVTAQKRVFKKKTGKKHAPDHLSINKSADAEEVGRETSRSSCSFAYLTKSSFSIPTAITGAPRWLAVGAVKLLYRLVVIHG